MNILPPRRLLFGCVLSCAAVAGCELFDPAPDTQSRYAQSALKTNATGTNCCAVAQQNKNVCVKSAIQGNAVPGPGGFAVAPAAPPAVAGEMPKALSTAKLVGEPPVAGAQPRVEQASMQSPAQETATIQAQAPVQAPAAVPVDPMQQAQASPAADKVGFPRGAPVVSRKGYADITAHPSFGHAPDYTWISGEVMCWRKEWRLRYATVDEIDPYGGSLRLSGEHEFTKLKDGEHYKIEGHLIPDDGRGPGFQIESVEPVN
jgi:hypothetical protein